MSTIQKILDTLQKASDDKKQQLNTSYQENSVWLKNEFDLIRQLILQNPRENLIISSSSSVPKKPSPQENYADDETTFNRKRKSSTSDKNGIKLSPEQKRLSVNIEDVLNNVGLPSDLNRLKKEQLLHHLEIRGNNLFSMKSLKKELIDNLKSVLIEEYKAQAKKDTNFQIQETFENNNNNNKDTSFDADMKVEQCSSEVEASVKKNNSLMKSPERRARSSVMNDLRTKVSEKTSLLLQEGQESGKSRVELEFQARQSRHRDSQVRKSQQILQENPKSDFQTENTPDEVTNEDTMDSELDEVIQYPDMEAPKEDIVKAEEETSVPTKLEAVEVKEDVWMEVASPKLEKKQKLSDLKVLSSVSKEQLGESLLEDGMMKLLPPDDSEEGPDEDNASSVVGSELEEETEEGESKAGEVVEPSDDVVDDQEFDDETENCENETAVNESAYVPPPPAESPAISISSVTSSVVSGKGGVRKFKKPSNLMGAPAAGSQISSFLDKAAPSKPVIPALEKAKKAKEAAELKAKIKKREQEVRAAAATQKHATKEPSSSPWGKFRAGKTNKGTKEMKKDGVPKKGIFNLFGGKDKGKEKEKEKTILNTSQHANTLPTSTSNNPKADLNPASHTQSGPVKLGSSLNKGEVMKPVKTNSTNSISSNTSSKSSTAAPTNTVNETAPVAIQQSMNPSMMSPPAVKPKGNKLMDVFSSKSMISSIVSNYNQAVTSGSKTASATKNPASVANPGLTKEENVLSDITATVGKSPFQSGSLAAVVAAKSPAPAPTQATKEYEIVDRDSSDDESGSGTDDDGSAEDRKKKQKQSVPDWARSNLLREALERQYGYGGHIPMDPDAIFPEVKTCSLEEIFGCREGINRKYSKRTSSAHWDADELTLLEKRAYRKHMGYDKAASTTVAN